MARPQDRFAAGIIDLVVILAPLVGMLTALTRRELVLGYYVEDTPRVLAAVLTIFLMSFGAALFYLSLSTHLFEATPGKLLMGLRIKSIFPDQRLTFSRILLRSFAWSLSLCALGVPFLEMFSNSRRRAWYDRIADTEVVSLSATSVSSPNIGESSFVRGVFASALAVAGLTMGVLFKEALSQMGSSWVLGGGESLCEDITERLGAKADSEARLEAAMTLFAIEEIDTECLEVEADTPFRLKRTDEYPLAYLAKSFAYSSRAELSDAYLKKVCQQNSKSAACELARMVGEWPGGVSESKPSGQKEFVRVWSYLSLFRKGEASRAEAYLKRFRKSDLLKNFYAREKLKILSLRQEWSQAETAFEFSSPFLSDMDHVLTGSQVCLDQLVQSCEWLKRPVCSDLRERLGDDWGGTSDVQMNLLELKVAQCQGRVSSIPPLTNEDVETLRLAVQGRSEKELLRLAESDEVDRAIQEEARRHWIEMKAGKDVLNFFKVWALGEPNPEWLKTGQYLLRRFRADGLSTESQMVAQRLSKFGVLPKTLVDSIPLDRWPAGEEN